MKLKDWLQRNNVTQREFAKLAGVTSQYIFTLCKGTMKCSLDLAKKIERLTEGQVRGETLMTKYAKKKARRQLTLWQRIKAFF